MQYKDGAWVYPCPFQSEIVDTARRILAWDLHAFDRWLYDGSEWSSFTCVRRRLIELRSMLASKHLETKDQIARELLVIEHCVASWRVASAGRRAHHEVAPELLETQSCAKLARKLHPKFAEMSKANKLHMDQMAIKTRYETAWRYQ